MNFKYQLVFTLIFIFGFGNNLYSQTISKEELIFLTSEWKGERFPDGRPKIPDELVERAKKIGIEEAWTVLRNEGYNNQFEGNWQMVHDDVLIVGRALTASFMPSRPDIVKNIKERGQQQGRIGDTNSWPIAELTKGDVYVADGAGKIEDGTLIGDNLGNDIFTRSGNGVIFDASARDIDGLSEIEGFNAFTRGFHPSYLKEMVLMGLNTPIRIGKAVVLPGDLVMTNREGVLFIPAHMAEKVIGISEFITLRDKYSREMLRSGKYNSGQIDSEWTDEIREGFLKWLEENPDEGKMSREELDKYMEGRTW